MFGFITAFLMANLGPIFLIAGLAALLAGFTKEIKPLIPAGLAALAAAVIITLFF